MMLKDNFHTAAEFRFMMVNVHIRCNFNEQQKNLKDTMLILRWHVFSCNRVDMRLSVQDCKYTWVTPHLVKNTWLLLPPIPFLEELVWELGLWTLISTPGGVWRDAFLKGTLSTTQGQMQRLRATLGPWGPQAPQRLPLRHKGISPLSNLVWSVLTWPHPFTAAGD